MPSTAQGIEFRRLTPAWTDSLALFFRQIVEAGDDAYFHPHSFTNEQARDICEYGGQDFYGVLTQRSSVLAYGMLRGWDEGYTVPSLGIAVAPARRGSGIGKTLMGFLHTSAQQLGATQVRLRVHPSNQRAIGMYQRLGYQFDAKQHEQNQLVGILDL